MSAFEKAVRFLPEEAGRALSAIPPHQQHRIQEIRLHRDGLLLLSLPEGEMAVSVAGELTKEATPCSVRCSAQTLERTFYKLCDYSVHTHSAELREGFVTARGGFRAGIAGTAVTENGEVTAVRDIRSICLRVAQRHDGSAAALLPLLQKGIPSMLIAGEPSSGKTSFLRDIGRMLAEGSAGRRYRVAVVDERGEIAGVGGLENADILTGCPKARGVLQAVRTLAPDVILLDELGTRAEVEAVTENLHAGVPAIATAHCRNIDEALSRPAIRLALTRRVFEKVVFLQGRDVPGNIAAIMGVEEIEAHRRARRDTRRHMHGDFSGDAAASPTGSVGENDPVAFRS